jgi:hypothetical protein
VEIPDRCGHLEELDAHGRPLVRHDSCTWLTEDIPVLAAVARLENAAEAPFDIDKEAIHVSKYLKAFEDGSIDQLYGGDSAAKVSLS